MPRKFRIDGDDSDRLPEGVKRKGYDADTQAYRYESVAGDEYEGEPGQRYGKLHRTRTAAAALMVQPTREYSQLNRTPSAAPRSDTVQRRHNSRRSSRAGRDDRGDHIDQAVTPKSPTSTTSRYSVQSTHNAIAAIPSPNEAADAAEENEEIDSISPSPPPRYETPRRNQTFSAILGPTHSASPASYPRPMTTLPPRRRADPLPAAPAPQTSSAGAAQEFCRQAGGYLKEVTLSVMHGMARSLKKSSRNLKKRREVMRAERKRREAAQAAEWI